MEDAQPQPVPSVPAAPAAAPDPRLDRLLEKVGILEQLFVKRIKDDGVHAAAYNTLHQDMSKYRDDAFRGAQKPLLKGLVLLYDTMKRSLAGLADGAGKAAVELHVEELLEVLSRHEVERMAEVPAKYDKAVQQALGTEPAAGPEEDQAVVRVVRDGFRWNGSVLRPQEVVIKSYKPT